MTLMIGGLDYFITLTPPVRFGHIVNLQVFISVDVAHVIEDNRQDYKESHGDRLAGGLFVY